MFFCAFEHEMRAKMINFFGQMLVEGLMKELRVAPGFNFAQSLF